MKPRDDVKRPKRQYHRTTKDIDAAMAREYNRWMEGGSVRTQRKIADIFGVSPATVSRAVRGVEKKNGSRKERSKLLTNEMVQYMCRMPDNDEQNDLTPSDLASWITREFGLDHACAVRQHRP